MRKTQAHALLGTMLGIALAGNAGAATVLVNANITTSQTWTANNVYRLQQQIYVEPGATLTIEPGTLIASTTNIGGSLAVTRGAKIYVNGTCDNPVIFTSTADVATWTAGNPKTGTWRAAANEWGNLTLMGKALIGDYVTPGNSPTCSSGNVAAMEGLVAAFPGDPNVLFGGGDDDDNSGSISYASFRYGGKVIGLGNELNGLSLGGIGRATNIDHVEIMNNVDDGIEIWGGTVNIKYFNIWNIGDDCFDVDKGWRGKAQFGLLVQGYSVDAAQGSGIGDNIFEMDGAEKADAQPVTTATIYNVTAIGQPVAGDEGTAWRDGARVQFRNCIFMDLGENLVENNNTDGDSGSVGYGFNGTLTYAQIWTTPYTSTSTVNPCPDPGLTYQAQSAGDASIGQGKLAEITDSVFFRNLFVSGAQTAYNNTNGSDAVGVTVAGGSNAGKGNVVSAYGGAGSPDLNMPIVALHRAPVVLLQGGTQPLIRVDSIDPRAANAAASSISAAPADGFFSQANYRGGFGPTENWLCRWTAADAYGFSVAPPGGCPNPCAVAPTPCPADIAPRGGNDVVDIDDLLTVINNWGATGGPADITGNGLVDIDDLLAVINAWGPCPL